MDDPNDIVASFTYCLHALRLDYKTTCDALDKWSGGDPQEQEFLDCKKKELFRALVEHSFNEIDTDSAP